MGAGIFVILLPLKAFAPVNTQDTRKIRLIMHLRNMGITNTAVLSAMERIPRETFVPPAFHDQAYEDIALPIGLGQTISQPLVVATMTQALEIGDRDKVLEVGTGCGYQAAILAKLCRRVYTIERHKPLFELAQKNFDELRIHNLTAICGDGMKGWPEQAPFDKIIVTAAAFEKPPVALLDQLKVGGVMVVPVGDVVSQVLRKYRKEADDTYISKDFMPVRFVPLLPDIARKSEYTEADLSELAG
ncbi:MAG: protein-L-isoaspartate(D-aspartate) O-methyltransferase [Alphaproteobacteria bacterium]|nr:protein-L-isoaspartate(D-aspartate) O-methyltransferase [Alphaproteobacteria bacterium]